MSIFSGILYEYPKFSVDNFNPLVSMYLLSHLHLDHINGIENFLPCENTKIYTSKITKKLLSGRHSEFKNIIPYVIGLELNKFYSFKYEGSINNFEMVDIALIPSGHCLGSVMFLIKGSKGNILYTGDFRFPIGYAATMLKEFNIDKLDTVYLDTTFMNKSCIYLPSREESLLTIMNLIEKFLSQDSQNVVHIDYKVRYTLDMLYHLIYLKFNLKVHVNWKYFSQISELDENFSSCMDPFNVNSRIHACFMGNFDNTENYCKRKLQKCKMNSHLLTIIPSTIWWSSRNLLGHKFVHYIDKYTVRVCYSHHSSYAEIIDFVTTVPTKSIHDCVSRSNFNLNQIKNLFI